MENENKTKGEMLREELFYTKKTVFDVRTPAELDEAREYATKLNNQQAVVNRTQQEVNKYEEALKEVSAAEKKAAKTGKTVEEVLDDEAYGLVTSKTIFTKT